MKKQIIGVLIATAVFSSAQVTSDDVFAHRDSTYSNISSDSNVSSNGESNGEFDIIIRDTKIDFNEMLDGVPVGAPYIENGRVFVPLRFLASHLGYDIEWINPSAESSQGTVLLRSPRGIEITFDIGENHCMNSGVKFIFDDNDSNIRTTIKDGRAYVPLRFFSEISFATVTYIRPSEEFPHLKKPTIYIDSETPKPQLVKPAEPTFNSVDFSKAKLTEKEHNSREVYQFNHTLRNGATIHEVLLYENDMLIKGYFNGVYYIASYSYNRNFLSFPFAHESILPIAKELRYVVEEIKPYHWRNFPQ